MTDVMNKIRRHLMERPVNIEAAISDVGLTLRKNSDLSDGIAGHIKRVQDDEFEIATTKEDHYFRQRFTMAHELGHYVLHRSLIGRGVDDNIKYRSTSEGEFYNTNIDEIHERQANAFAANLLIPERLLRSYINDHSHQTLKQVANAFQVSPSAMRWRLKNLGLYDGQFNGQ